MELSNALNIAPAKAASVLPVPEGGLAAGVVRGAGSVNLTFHAIARHVSEEGCLFLVSRGNLQPGDTLLVSVATLPSVRGVVRWVQEDRLGFAFRQALPEGMVRALADHARVGLPLTLERC